MFTARKFFVLVLMVVSPAVLAQKVAVVMSGGAAKGIAHIGVLKALEENEIPINYIVGSSMGAIVGGCYAAGMSPGQIEEIFLSEDFQDWVNGKPDVEYNYYSNQHAQPSFLKVNLSLDSSRNISFNGSLANDLSLNFALAEKLAQPTANAQADFDKLFVPLRVVAADIFTQSQIILDHGNLSDALRASQTVPFFYKPIKIDGKYLFDGGVYNNFPVDIAQKEFEPDVIIGSNVSSKVFDEYPYEDDEKLMSKMLLYLFLDKSDPKSIPESGVYISPAVSKYSNFDFAYARALIDSGYNQTMRQMEEIKAKIGTRITCESVAESRNLFNNRNTAFLFDKIQFQGFKKTNNDI
ncbi:MAG: patatin-like phospholipase family protein [Flammeovirgaceae bacterium]|nr:patatin-like phospholipase family protein [Flammeovirgaceae bacterium]